MSSEVAIIDISAFSEGKPISAKADVAKQFKEACSKNGFVGISGHGLPDDVLAQAFKISAQFFALPYDDKMKAPHPPTPMPHRGYSGPGLESAQLKNAADTNGTESKLSVPKTFELKETYEIGSDDDQTQPNIWLPDAVLPGFRSFMTDLYWSLNKIATTVTEIITLSLDLTEEEALAIKQQHDGNYNQLRLAHYLAMDMETAAAVATDSVRLGAHTDGGYFTILFQDSNGGLEFLDQKTKEFVEAKPKEGVLYLNAGDMLTRWSNGCYPSALHRVVSPKSTGNGVPQRFSIPYFVGPNPFQVVAPQPSLVERDGKALYEPITFMDYLEELFAKIRNTE